MNLISVFILIASLLAVVSANECVKDLPPCDGNPDVAKISCEDGSCSVDPESKGDLLGDPAITGISAIDCIAKCEEQAGSGDDPKCDYYRWDTDSKGSKTSCSMQTTCFPDPWGCDDSKCKTGQIWCTDEGEREPQPCSLASATSWDSNKFHVVCFGPRHQEVNIYNSEIKGKIPADTVCQTARKCAAWPDLDTDPGATYHRKLAIYCDGTDSTWKKVAEETGSDADSDAMITGGDTIVEPTCATSTVKCLSLKLTHTDDVGVDLICENSLGPDIILADDNSCIMLCDNHWAMSISCELSWDGEKTWLDDDRNVITDDRVRCY